MGIEISNKSPYSTLYVYEDYDGVSEDCVCLDYIKCPSSPRISLTLTASEAFMVSSLLREAADRAIVKMSHDNQ
jgi:hypothetical protein